MFNGKKITIVMPAFNAAKTLQKTFDEVRHKYVDEIVLVDDGSWDNTAEISKQLGIRTIVHAQNKGYGANQKTCYQVALELNSDIVVMLHPDYQYTPKLLVAMISLIAEDLFDCVLGSRILGVGALKGGMPLYKYVSNRFLTFVQNILLNYKLSEYHTGYRAFSREVLEALPLDGNSDDFVFDNQMLSQIIYGGYSIGEISCPTLYMEDSSSINLSRSIEYGIGVLLVSLIFRLTKWGIMKNQMFTKVHQKPE